VGRTLARGNGGGGERSLCSSVLLLLNTVFNDPSESFGPVPRFERRILFPGEDAGNARVSSLGLLTINSGGLFDGVSDRDTGVDVDVDVDPELDGCPRDVEGR